MCRERGLAPRGSGEDACGCVILVVLRLDLKFGEATTVPQSSLAPTRVSKGARPFDSSQGRLRGTRFLMVRKKSEVKSGDLGHPPPPRLAWDVTGERKMPRPSNTGLNGHPLEPTLLAGVSMVPGKGATHGENCQTVPWLYLPQSFVVP